MELPTHNSVQSLTIEDVVAAGLPLPQAETFYELLQKAISAVGRSPPATWRWVSKELLTPSHPHALHQLMYYSIYSNWDVSKLGPPLAWFPTQEGAKSTNLGCLLDTHGKRLLGTSYHNPIVSYSAFQQFTTKHPDVYWSLVLKELSVSFHVQPRSILGIGDVLKPSGNWLPGAILNVAECCLTPKIDINKTDDINAIIWRDEGQDDLPVKMMKLRELRAKVSYVANALDAAGFEKGDSIAIDMPMNVDAVIIYLAIVLAGYVVVSIADSFSPQEIATRLQISNAKCIFTQDYIFRGGKKLPLYRRVVEASPPLVVVLPIDGDTLDGGLRKGDIYWDKFLSFTKHLNRPEEYKAMSLPVDAYTNILFSSGTTGTPKAIPWTQLSCIRCGAESWAHKDLKVGDVFVWPTNLGWMMGPFLIYGCLLTGTSIGLYNGSPLGGEFGKFVQDAGTTKLGTVPSMVKTWKKTGCINGADWSCIQIFFSTGEASSVDDDLWLSARGWYNPVVECCGGTELSATFLHGCLLQPQALAVFSTPSMTTSFVTLNEEGKPYENEEPCIGEIALMPFFMGASNVLLNADHDAVYFKDMPYYHGQQLRRHGDVFERLVGGYYKAHGRCDDTMNLGGIKVSAVELERVCNKSNSRILETAAVSIPSPGGGPEQLVIFVVVKDKEDVNLSELKLSMTKSIRNELNPLFKVSSVVNIPNLPRTASNKVMRRVLRGRLVQNSHVQKSRL